MDRRTDGQADMKKLIAAFRNFRKRLKTRKFYVQITFISAIFLPFDRMSVRPATTCSSVCDLVSTARTCKIFIKYDVLILYKTYRVKRVFGKIQGNGTHKLRVRSK